MTGPVLAEGGNDDRGSSLSALRASTMDDTSRHNRIEFSTDGLVSSSLEHHLSLASSTAWHSRLASCSEVMGRWCGGGSRLSADIFFLRRSVFSEWLLSVCPLPLLAGVLFGPMDWMWPGLVRVPVCCVSLLNLMVEWSAAGVMVHLYVSLVLPADTTGTECSESGSILPDLVIAAGC